MQAAVVDVRHDLGPFPAVLDQLGLDGQQLFRGEPVEQFGIGDPAFAVGVKQVAQDAAASFLIGFDGDEPRELAVGIDMPLGQHDADSFPASR